MIDYRRERRRAHAFCALYLAANLAVFDGKYPVAFVVAFGVWMWTYRVGRLRRWEADDAELHARIREAVGAVAVRDPRPGEASGPRLRASPARPSA